MKNKIKEIAAAGVFCAFAYVLTNIGNIIPIRFAGFLSFDPKDAMIVMAGFAIGPWAAVGITFACAFLELVTISTTGAIGFLMNVLSSLCFALIPALIYKKRPTFFSAIVSLLASSCLTVVAMLAWNAFITPVYMKVPREAVIDMLPTVFLPFNVIKCIINVVIIVCLYKSVIKVPRKIKLVSPRKNEQMPRSTEAVNSHATPVYFVKVESVERHKGLKRITFSLCEKHDN
jgi:riboflavin transporter FmnP